MNAILNAFLRGMKQGAHAYFAPMRWTVCALRRAAEDAFGESNPPQHRFKLSR